ncbi:MAG: hypothetical protein A2743_03565 [Candidatus Taylorbacteria bacterium RIFCSPHIGHO2_01_FULL_43_47]|nr:MAG: hypothetical protein A2743_03565 [Candidatus Taylorbacteria bacterium RIFCSPHIGHO2_01_FULL_43_47]
MGYGHRERAEFCAKCVDQDGKFLKTFEETQKRGRLDVEQLVLKAADHAKIARPPQIGNSSIGGKSRGQLASFFPKWLTSIFS